jgi:hypothetical protein
MTDSLPDGFKVTRLPRNGPKPGQSLRSYFAGRANGDRKWERIREKNFKRLLQPRPNNRPPAT